MITNHHLMPEEYVYYISQFSNQELYNLNVLALESLFVAENNIVQSELLNDLNDLNDSTNYEPTNYEPTNYDSTNHDPTNHDPTNYDSTNYEPTNYEPTNSSYFNEEFSDNTFSIQTLFLRNSNEIINNEGEFLNIETSNVNNYIDDKTDKKINDLITCSVCLTNIKNTTLISCRHTFCNTCVAKITNKKCPICRKIFTKNIDFYL